MPPEPSALRRRPQPAFLRNGQRDGSEPSTAYRNLAIWCVNSQGSLTGQERTHPSRQVRFAAALQSEYGASHRRLLETSRRAGVWPDSVQVLGGTLALRPVSYTHLTLPTNRE